MPVSSLAKSNFRVPTRLSLMGAILVAVAALLGAMLMADIGNMLQSHIEKGLLRLHAQALQDRARDLDAEAGQSIAAIAANRLLPCSNADLAFMRKIVIASEHLRDVGRLVDGKLACSAILGRLDAPALVPPPNVVDSTGRSRVWNSGWPILPAPLHCHFIESMGAWAEINEQTLRGQDPYPSTKTSEFLYDRSHNRLVPSFGPGVPLSQSEIVSGLSVERAGILYESLCRVDTAVCVVVSEPSASFFSKHPRLFWGRIAAGGLLGALAAVLIVLADFKRNSLESELRRAILKGKLSVVYQPIVDLDTRTIVGAETLVRWVKRNGETIPPDVFIPIAETRGFVDQITRLVIARVVKELGDVLAGGKFHVTVNITAQDLTNPCFLAELESTLSLAGIRPSAIGLELTERSTADPVMATEALARLKQAGFLVYIDDFGTGYSSLAYLHRLAVNFIKIDRVFTQTIGTGSVTASVVPQILDLARTLNLQVVVEGIETEEQAAYFCNEFPGARAQGWLFGRAVAAENLRRMIQATRQQASIVVAPSPTVRLGRTIVGE